MGVLDEFSRLFAMDAGQQLRTLLSEKHLYQKIRLDANALVTSMSLSHGERYYRTIFEDGLARPLILTENIILTGGDTIELLLPVQNVKLYCEKCGSREAFRPIYYEDVTQAVRGKHDKQRTFGAETFRIRYQQDLQLFVLVYLCQVCESRPTGFLIKRDGMDLFVEGRSPIEHVEVPAFIPKKELKWFRDSVIAFQTQKVLAALFYLRTFVEQFARRQTGKQKERETGDAILDAYAQTIPENIRSTMPSLRDWYDKLSEAIHAANEDATLFESARKEIERHFDIRRVHKLEDDPPKG